MIALTARLRRPLLSLAAVALLAPAAAGCVTVHGELALLPAVDAATAARVLDHFTAVNNEANTRLDPSLNGQIETGALGAIDQAGIRARHITSPAGNPGYQPLQLTDARFLIPEQRGWPKWFVADAASNRDTDRWLLVFARSSNREAWRAEYLSVVPQADLPAFATDSSGHAEPVAPDAADLLVAPGRLSAAYTAYLQQGDAGSADFAPGSATTGLREQRRTQYPPTPQVVTQFADEPADPAQFPPVALRLKDGGALVFFTSHDVMKQTVGKGPLRLTDPYVKALLTGTANTSITLSRVAEQVVTVPPAGQAGAKVAFLNRIEGLVSAQGG